MSPSVSSCGFLQMFTLAMAKVALMSRPITTKNAGLQIIATGFAMSLLCTLYLEGSMLSKCVCSSVFVNYGARRRSFELTLMGISPRMEMEREVDDARFSSWLYNLAGNYRSRGAQCSC